jgi:chemosensory pili system protein ChpC
MAEAQVELRSLLIPLAGEPALLPSAVVSEVTGYTQPTPVADAPEWLIGTIPWRQRDLPVISLEAALGNPRPANFGNRARIIIVYGLKNTEQLPFYGIVAHGIPRAFMASGETVQEAPAPESRSPFLREQVMLTQSGPAVIPDMDGLHEALMKYTV